MDRDDWGCRFLQCRHKRRENIQKSIKKQLLILYCNKRKKIIQDYCHYCLGRFVVSEASFVSVVELDPAVLLEFLSISCREGRVALMFSWFVLLGRISVEAGIFGKLVWTESIHIVKTKNILTETHNQTYRKRIASGCWRICSIFLMRDIGKKRFYFLRTIF